MNATLSRRRFLAWLAASSAAGVVRGAPATPAGEVIEQSAGVAACGPCALANALLHGDAGSRRAFHALPGANSGQRVDALIRLYAAKPSETYGSRRGRFVAEAGLTCEDMPFLANDVLAGAGQPPVRGDWLDQSGQEDERAQLRRVHGLFAASLARGLPPVVEVRAFAAGNGEAKSSWINLYAHWLALIDIGPAELPVNSSGFPCRFADSYTGRVIAGFAYAERFRPFMATRGFSLKANGDKDWHWLSGHPYILLTLPDVSLDLEGLPGNERAVVAFTYAIHRPAA